MFGVKVALLFVYFDARIFWIETLGLFAYWLWLVVFYFRSARQ